MIEE
jgi:hypothetical protein